MFFEINKRATELLQTFRDILNIKDRYNRKNEFLKIKSQFYEYILSVKFSETTKSYFTSFEDIGNIKIVDMEGVNSPQRGWFKLSFGGNLKKYFQVKKNKT